MLLTIGFAAQLNFGVIIVETLSQFNIPVADTSASAAHELLAATHNPLHGRRGKGTARNGNACTSVLFAAVKGAVREVMRVVRSQAR